MEEDKKKKKSKKKKSKHTKTTEGVTVNNGEPSPPEQNHIVIPEKNQCVQIWGLAENDKSGSSEPDTKLEKDLTDEAKNAMLEEVSRQFEAEKQSWLQREARLEEQIKQVVSEKRSWLLKEARLEEQIKQVVSEKRSWLLKEATIAEEIKHLEREKDSWITKEIFAKETIARLSEVNQQLETQVNELEGSRNGLLEERQQLVESMSVLESRIQQLEREALPPASSTEELMKVNELYVELNGQGRFVGDSFATRVDSLEAETVSAGASIIVSADTPSMMNVNMLTAKDEEISVDDADQAEDSNILTEIQEEGELEAYYTDKVGKNVTSTSKGDIPVVDMQEEVSLIEAPLIGAPFRLISFVAKYVSGADLVDWKN